VTQIVLEITHIWDVAHEHRDVKPVRRWIHPFKTSMDCANRWYTSNYSKVEFDSTNGMFTWGAQVKSFQSKISL
jgi:hypothetical protein